MTDLTDKQKADLYREAAITYDVLAEKMQPLDSVVADLHRRNAQTNRDIADRFDQNQLEWNKGDLVLDCDSELWQFDGSYWRQLNGTKRAAKSLINVYGPLRKARIADPAKFEVVVSLADIDLNHLLSYAEREYDTLSTLSGAGVRVAKAAREQLGESADVKRKAAE